MGSFNTTCFASNQTIAPGDNCQMLPILQQSTYTPVEVTSAGETEQVFGIANSSCYPDCFWKPAGAWIPATYDDYGRVQLRLDAFTRNKLLTFFLRVMRDCPEVAQGENPCHELPFDFPAFLREKAPGVQQVLLPVHKYHDAAATEGSALDEELAACWRYVYDVASKNRLFIRCSSNQLRPLQFAVLHERAYESLVQSVSAQETWDDESCEPVPFLTRVFADAQKHVDKMTAPLANAAQVLDEDKANRMRSFFFAEGWCSGLSSLDAGSSYPRSMETAVTRELSEQLVKGKLTKEQVIDAYLPLLRDRYVLAGLNSMSLRITPLIFSGQDNQNAAGTAYLQFVASVNKVVTKDRKTHQYGEYQRYSLQAPTREGFEALVTELGQCDSDADDIVYEAVAGTPEVTVTFFSPSDLEHLTDVITSLPSPALMLESLKAL